MADHDTLIEELGLAQRILGATTNATAAGNCSPDSAARDDEAAQEAPVAARRLTPAEDSVPPSASTSEELDEAQAAADISAEGGLTPFAAQRSSGTGLPASCGVDPAVLLAAQADEADLDEETLALFADMDRIVDA